MKISASEYRGRQDRFAAALTKSDLAGAIVVSRGGATYDRYGNVLYLTGHYQHYSYLPDSPGLFSGRAHTAFVISATGENILCVSVPEFDPGVLTADRISHSDSFVATLVNALRSLNLAGARLGLIGGDVLPVNQWLALGDALPEVSWQPCDELLMQQRRIKSPAEQELIRSAAATNRRAVTALLDAIKPGVTEAQAMAEAARVIVGEGAAIYYAVISSGDRSWQWATSPLPGYSDRVLGDGELVRFDLGIVKDGYMSDFGRAVVAGQPNARQQHLLDTLHAGLDTTIGAIGPGIAVRDVVAKGEEKLRSLGVINGDPKSGVIVASFPAHWGHALGVGWERPWMTAEETLTIEAGMYLAIERALTLEGVGTVAAEQNLLVHRHGIELLTAGTGARWS